MIAARRGVPCCERPEAETPQTRTIHDGPLARDLKLIKHALMVVEMNAAVNMFPGPFLVVTLPFSVAHFRLGAIHCSSCTSGEIYSRTYTFFLSRLNI